MKVEIENRTCADRNLYLILKILFNPFIPHHLILRHIHWMYFYIETILYRAAYSFREGCCVAFSIGAFKDLSPVFGDNPWNLNIYHLSGFIPYSLVLTLWKCFSDYLDIHDKIWGVKFLEGSAGMSFLSSSLAVSCFLLSLFPVGVWWRMLAAVSAVEAQLLIKTGTSMSNTSMVLFKAGETPGSFSSNFLVFSIVASISMDSIFIQMTDVEEMNEDIITQAFEANFFERGGFLMHFKILGMAYYTSIVKKCYIIRSPHETPIIESLLQFVRKIKLFAKTPYQVKNDIKCIFFCWIVTFRFFKK